MPSKRAYDADVPRNKDLKAVVAANVGALMSARKMSQPQVAALAKQRGHKIDQTTVGRIARGAIPTTVERLAAVAAGLGVDPWQLMVEDLDPRALPAIGASLAADENELLAKYRAASARWKIALRHMAGLREDNEQEEVAGGMNILVAEILGRRHFPVEKMPRGWDAPRALQQPKGKYQKDKK